MDLLAQKVNVFSPLDKDPKVIVVHLDILRLPDQKVKKETEQPMDVLDQKVIVAYLAHLDILHSLGKKAKEETEEWMDVLDPKVIVAYLDLLDFRQLLDRKVKKERSAMIDPVERQTLVVQAAVLANQATMDPLDILDFQAKLNSVRYRLTFNLRKTLKLPVFTIYLQS